MTDKKLNLEEKQKVQYCIDLWLRDEQIRSAIKRQLPRIEPHHDPRSEPIAVVGFGPSLKETFEKIREFKYVISCSGAHKFLIEKGIIPTWHVEVDPREHKVTLLGEPHKDVEYLVASTCHPKYFDHLREFKVKLWHVFDCTEDGQRMLPPGDWAITGGCDVGLRAMTIAGFFGFRDLHIFGLDGSNKDSSHAAFHPNEKKKSMDLEYDGVTYKTTPAQLEAAKQVWHELDQMPAVKTTFYGEGLIQHMARNYKPKAPDGSKPMIVAVQRPELISNEYKDLNKKLHEENLAFGVGGNKHCHTILLLAASLNTTSILDYGCGKGLLAKSIPFPIWEYDPAIAGKEESPRPADLVVCTDVLEHIEPDKLEGVLMDLKRVTRRIAYFVIHTGPSSKNLADGRNSHLIQKGAKWWYQRLANHFQLAPNSVINQPPLIYVVAAAKG